MIATGLGIGATLPVFTLAVQNAFEYSKLGIATASTQLFRSIGATVGTAVLGSVLNARLARELGNLADDPFIRVVARAHPELHLERADANALQAILTQPLRGSLDAEAHQAFLSFLARSRQAFAVSITETFFIAAVLMGVGLCLSFFLREIPLRKSQAES